MKRRLIFRQRAVHATAQIVVVVIAATLTRVSVAQSTMDRVRTAKGAELGEVSGMTAEKVQLTKKPSGNTSIAVNEITSIVFDGEPAELGQARVKAANGAYAEAADLLEKIDATKVKRDLIKQDIEFYKLYCAAQLALGGRGTINEAGTQLISFTRAFPKNFHYYQAVETIGDLLAAAGKLDAAQKQYNELAKAPWPEYRLRAAVGIGHAMQGQGKHADAIPQFDMALAMIGTGPSADNEKLAATLGKAISLAETGQGDKAISMIEKVILDADPEQKALQARAYNAMGSCYLRAGQKKEALMAYLHVDWLYNSVPDAHAEALANLVPLWQAVGQEGRAREARQTLQEKYAGSKWAK